MKRVLLLFVPLLFVAGCVERKLIIRSEPDAADLWVNRSVESVGQTTHEQEFSQHGTFAVRLEKEGYEVLEERARVRTPWYSWPILDFITEVLVPFTIRDHHEFTYELVPVAEVRPWEEAEEDVLRHRDAVISRSEELRREVLGMESPESEQTPTEEAAPVEPDGDAKPDGDDKP